MRYDNDVVWFVGGTVSKFQLVLQLRRRSRREATDVGAAVPGTEFCSRLDTCEIFFCFCFPPKITHREQDPAQCKAQSSQFSILLGTSIILLSLQDLFSWWLPLCIRIPVHVTHLVVSVSLGGRAESRSKFKRPQAGLGKHGHNDSTRLDS